MGFLKKLEKNGLSALTNTLKGVATGNPIGGVISGVSTLLGGKDMTEKELDKALDNPENLKILKAHQERMLELDIDKQKAYLQSEENIRQSRVKLYELQLKDVQNARDMYKESKDFTDNLTKFYLIGFFILLPLVLAGNVFVIHYINTNGLSTEIAITAGNILGAGANHLYHQCNTIFNFYYGSMKVPKITNQNQNNSQK